MFFGAVVALTLSSAKYEIATMTRVYYPAGNRKISHFAVCLVSLNGHIRRLKELKSREFWHGPVWKDRNHLLWVEAHKSGEELWQAELPGFHVTRLKTSKQIDFNYPDLREGVSLKLNSQGKEVSVLCNGKSYHLQNSGIRWEQSTTSDGKWTIGLSEIGNEAFSTRARKVGRYSWIAGNFGFTAHDEVCLLLRLDKPQKEARIFPVDAETIRFAPQSNHFFALSGRRLSGLGDLAVWVSDISQGSLVDGKPHRIPLPFSYTISIAIRPPK